MNELKEQILKDFEEKFYEGDRKSIHCIAHKTYATPIEMKSFVISAITTAYEKGREDSLKENCKNGIHKFIEYDEWTRTCIYCGKLEN